MTETASNILTGIILGAVVVLFGVWTLNNYSNRDNGGQTKGTSFEGNETQSKGYCVDVTSIDYNWDNDMKCTRPDGSVFYTDYSGARDYESQF